MTTPMLLSKYTIFQSQQAREAEDSLYHNLCPHSLTVYGGSMNAVHNRVCLPLSELSFVSYGTRVQVGKARAADSYLLLLGHSGKSRLKLKRDELLIAKGTGAIVAPDTSFTIDGDADASALVWKLNQHAVAKQAALLMGREPAATISFMPNLAVTAGTGASFARALYFITDELEAQESVLQQPHTLSLMEQSLTMALLYAQPSNLQALHDGSQGGIAPACVRRVEDYIQANIAEDISTETLIRVSGVPGRTLFRTFRQFKGMSPMSYLRNLRMRRIRADLLSPPQPGLTVTDVLSYWGISQFGRFAAEYKKKYGELPSQTLRGLTKH